jgi:hypothetical protein
MKAKEFIIELKKESKPRNFVAKNAKMGGAGQHKDKKKAEKQGDAKHKNKQMDMAESNVMERDREDDEGWGSMNKRDFKRAELQHELGHEKNNLQVSINGRPWKVFPGRGYADSQEERSYLRSMQSWAEKKSAATGKKWTVSLTGLDPS